MTHEPTSSSNVVWSATDLDGDPHAAADKADRVQRMFSGIAPSYDLNNRLHSFGRDQAWRRAAVRLANVGPEDRVLDVACGTGDLTEAFARAQPAEAIGVDFTEPMLEIARRKSARRKRAAAGPTPSYQWADATDLPFEDARFDVVSIAFGIRNVSVPERALREFRRVLDGRGRLVILEFSHPRNPVLRGLSNLYTNRIMPLTATLVARDRTGAYRYLPKSVATFPPREELVRMLEGAGFHDVTQHELSLGICVAYVATGGEAESV